MGREPNTPAQNVVRVSPSAPDPPTVRQECPVPRVDLDSGRYEQRSNMNQNNLSVQAAGRRNVRRSWILTFVLLALVGAGCSRAPQAVHYGLPATSGPFGLRSMRMPLVPKGWPKRPEYRGSWAVGFLRNGDLVEFIDAVAARYDPARHRFRHGFAYVVPRWGIAAPGRDKSVWEWGGEEGTIGVAYSDFGKHPEIHVPGFHHWTGPNGQSNGLAIDRAGNAWVAGWRVRNRYWGDWINDSSQQQKHHAKGLPLDIPKGYAALFFDTPKKGVVRLIRAPAAGPLTGVALFGHNLWTIDPFERCPRHRPSSACSPPRILRYDLKTKRFRTFLIPPRIRPRIPGETASAMQNFNEWYYRTPMATGPNGALWTVALSWQKTKARRGRRTRTYQQYILIRLQRGHYSRYPLWRTNVYSDSGPPAPIVDSKGRVWLQHILPWQNAPGPNRLWVLTPSTGRITVLPKGKGNLLQDARGRVWYVRGPGVPY